MTTQPLFPGAAHLSRTVDGFAQRARNLVIQFSDEQPFRFLIHDRDAKFSHAFDEVFRSEGIKVIRTPVQAPNANAHAERWVRTLRADCLDRILVFGRHTSSTSSCLPPALQRAQAAPRTTAPAA